MVNLSPTHCIVDFSLKAVLMLYKSHLENIEVPKPFAGCFLSGMVALTSQSGPPWARTQWWLGDVRKSIFIFYQ